MNLSRNSILVYNKGNSSNIFGGGQMVDIISIFEKEIIIILIAAAPVVELRAAIPIAISLGVSPIHSMILSIIGNMLPIPFLLMILKPAFNYLSEKRAFKGIVSWIKKRTLKKSRQMEKYKIFGLFLLVAIPLPATGAWTGAIAASLFNINFKQAFLTILAGVITAGIIVVILSTQAKFLLDTISFDYISFLSFG